MKVLLSPLIAPSAGHFLAGFIEGEGHFAIAAHNGGQSRSCALRLGVRDEDLELINWVVAQTGLGSLRRIAGRATSRPQVEWTVSTQSDCIELVRLLERFPLRGRAQRRFGIWAEAVRVWTTEHRDRRERMRDLQRRRPLSAGRSAAATGCARR